MLIEPGDKIQIGGKYQISSPVEFSSDGKKFMLEKGDTFDVLEEGFWEALKMGFSGKTRAQAVAKIYSVVRDITDMIMEMHSDWVEENPNLPKEQSPYGDIITSKQFYLMRRISQTGGDPKKMRQLMIVKKADPIEAINQVRDKAADIGATELAKYIDEITPAAGIMDKLGKVWRSVSGQPGSGTQLEKRRQKVGTDADGNKYIVVGSEIYGPIGSSAARWIGQTGPNEYGSVKIVNVEMEAAPPPPPKGGEPPVSGAKPAPSPVPPPSKPKPDKSGSPMPKRDLGDSIDKALDDVVGESPDQVRIEHVWDIMKQLIESGNIVPPKVKSRDVKIIANMLNNTHGEKLVRSDIKKAYDWGNRNDPIKVGAKPAPSPEKETAK